MHVRFLVRRRPSLNVSDLPKVFLSGWTWLETAGPQIERELQGTHRLDSPHTHHPWRTDCRDDGEQPLLVGIYDREGVVGAIPQIRTMK